MKNTLLATLVGLLAFAGTSSAHQERLFDAGKSAYFKQLADSAENRISKRGKHSKTEAKCEGGFAAGLYPCKNIDLLSHIDIDALGVSFVNDIWGWTDRKKRREYVLLGAVEGTIVIDVTKPTKPVVLGMLPSASNLDNPFWRDIKVYKGHAFIVSEHTDHGMQVLDLRQLHKIKRKEAPVVLQAAAQYDGFSSAHNIAINEKSGYAYVVGTDTCLGGIEVVDISKPADPKESACFDQHGYVHDTQCVNYKGSDKRFRNREICFNSSANLGAPYSNSLSIVDVTDKSKIIALANVEYGAGYGYSHQGWLTPDQKHYIHGDELDEYFGSVTTTTTRVWNVENLTDPQISAVTTNDMTSIDHNLYTRDNLSYASNYTTGLRIFDIKDIAKGEYREVAYFDVYPENDNASFEGGTWSNYAYFKKKGLVAVSSMDRGLFLLKTKIKKEKKSKKKSKK